MNLREHLCRACATFVNRLRAICKTTARCHPALGLLYTATLVRVFLIDGNELRPDEVVLVAWQIAWAAGLLNN